MEENDDHNVYHSSTEESPAKQSLSAHNAKDTTENLTNGPEDSILPKDVQISNGKQASDCDYIAPQNSKSGFVEKIAKKQDGIKVPETEVSSDDNSPPPAESSSSVTEAENSLANSEVVSSESGGGGDISKVREARMEEGVVETIGHKSSDGDGQNTQTSFVNELALASTGISSQADRNLRDCNSSQEQLDEGGGGDKKFSEEKDKDEDQLRDHMEDGDPQQDKDQRDKNMGLDHRNGDRNLYQDQNLDQNQDQNQDQNLDQNQDPNLDQNQDPNLDQNQDPNLDHNQDQNLGNGDQDKDRSLEQFSEILLDSDLSESEDAAEVETSERENGSGAAEGAAAAKKTKRVRFADEIAGANGKGHGHRSPPPAPSSLPDDSPNTIHSSVPITPSPTSPKHKGPPVQQFSMTELINGVEMPAEYLGSTPIMLGGTGTIKAARMYQAQQAVQLVKDPESESRPRFAVNVKISTAAIVLADRATGLDLMDHPLHTITYVADIDHVLVIMAHVLPTPVTSPSAPSGDTETPSSNPLPSVGQDRVNSSTYIPKLTCHVLDAPNARSIAMVIGQAFSAAYKQALRASGVTEEQLEQAEYSHILNAQSVPKLEVESLGDRNKTKKLTLAKHKNDMMGIMVTESGYGSAIPALVIVHLSKTGSAIRSGLLNVGDHILSINGVNLVGMPRKTCIEQIKKCRPLNVVKMEVCSCPAVVDITIVRPDLKFQLGFTVHDGMICSLMRGSIAERSGIRVGHRIIEINGTSTVGMQHAETVHLLSSTVGDLHIRTMADIMYRLLTGRLQPEYY